MEHTLVSNIKSIEKCEEKLICTAFIKIKMTVLLVQCLGTAQVKNNHLSKKQNFEIFKKLKSRIY